jgi:hypothetical protein
MLIKDYRGTCALKVQVRTHTQNQKIFAINNSSTVFQSRIHFLEGKVVVPLAENYESCQNRD